MDPVPLLHEAGLRALFHLPLKEDGIPPRHRGRISGSHASGYSTLTNEQTIGSTVIAITQRPAVPLTAVEGTFRERYHMARTEHEPQKLKADSTSSTEEILELLQILKIRQDQLSKADMTMQRLRDDLISERATSADYQTSNYLARTRIAELLRQLETADTALRIKGEELKKKDLQLQVALEELESQSQEIQLSIDAHEETSLSLLAAEIERDLILEAQMTLERELKESNDALASVKARLDACTATLDVTAAQATAKDTELETLKEQAERCEATLIKRLQQECDAHRDTREALSAAQRRISSLTQECDEVKATLEITREELNEMRHNSLHDTTSFELARQENNILGERLESINRDYRMLETSKRSIAQAFSAKIKLCDTLEKENAILKTPKRVASMPFGMSKENMEVPAPLLEYQDYQGFSPSLRRSVNKPANTPNSQEPKNLLRTLTPISKTPKAHARDPLMDAPDVLLFPALL